MKLTLQLDWLNPTRPPVKDSAEKSPEERGQINDYYVAVTTVIDPKLHVNDCSASGREGTGRRFSRTAKESGFRLSGRLMGPRITLLGSNPFRPVII